MPLDMAGSTAVLDDEAPIESAPHKKSHYKKETETKSSLMSADDTDTDR